MVIETPGDDDDDHDKDDDDDKDDVNKDIDDKPVDEQWWRKCLGPWPDPSRRQAAQFLLGSQTPLHDDI